MRADARRNHDRIVAAARDLFERDGADASLNEIAKRAGVGAGTLYRHFPRREGLLDAATAGWAQQVAASADDADDSRHSARDRLVPCLSSAVAGISRHHGLAAKLLAGSGGGQAPVYGDWLALARANTKIVEALAAEGALRDGVTTAQVGWLVCGLAAAADHGRLSSTDVDALVEIAADGLLR